MHFALYIKDLAVGLILMQLSDFSLSGQISS